MKIIYIIFLIISAGSCGNKSSTMIQENQEQNALTFLALGDSYTIGESVEDADRYPEQLKAKLLAELKRDVQLQVIAKTGWRTDDLMNAIQEASLTNGSWDLVTLLIGVNNQYQGKDFTQYEEELKVLIEKSIELAGSKDRVIIISIPDYSVTPFASSGDTAKIADELKKYNDLKEKYASEYEISFVYITDLTQNAKSDESLLAVDKLHPSGKSYGQWVERLAPVALEKVK